MSRPDSPAMRVKASDSSFDMIELPVDVVMLPARAVPNDAACGFLAGPGPRPRRIGLPSVRFRTVARPQADSRGAADERRPLLKSQINQTNRHNLN